jgi:cytochrome c oxidase subunit 3
MWTFLATEILMFGGLFCAYGVYRHNHPDVFAFAHEALDRKWGAINTVVLIASSLTMAWAVRAAQLNQRKLTSFLLFLTLLGGAGFMAIKSIEYHAKWEHHLFPGRMNVYNAEYAGKARPYVDLLALKHGDEEAAEGDVAPKPAAPAAKVAAIPPDYVDPNAGTADAAKIRANFAVVPGLSDQAKHQGEEHITLMSLNNLDRKRINTFFSVYFLMTGLHGIHVLIGMGLIAWILFRSLRGEFSSKYFAPVDLVGLYWHLVDLIWIFLFPLLYLIH